MKKKSFIRAFSSIFKASKDSQLQIDDAAVKKDIAYLKGQLGFDEVTIILLSAMIGLDEDEESIPMKTLAGYFGMGKLDMYEYGASFNALDDSGYIVNNNFNSVAVTSQAIGKLVENKPYKKTDTSNWPVEAVIKEFRACLRAGDRSMPLHQWEVFMKDNPFVAKVEMMAGDLLSDSPIVDLLDQNAVRVVRNIIFYFIGSYCYNKDEEARAVGEDDLFNNFFYREQALKGTVFSVMLAEDESFIKSGFFAYPCVDGMVDDKQLVLTEKAANLLGLKPINESKESIDSDMLVKHTDIQQKDLFYDEKTRKDVDRLTHLLSKEQLGGIQKRLQEAKMRTGFTVLLYGAPGTGKTETVLQLAKATGRDIMQVNYEDLKNKYVGDSEKQVKKLFNDYREIVESNEVTPILLFNEADGILGKRKQGAENAVDKMENTVQNIILQEMEKLNGIMIATTNLTCNFDSAFERRFLYKIKYEKPDKTVRAHIWHSMINELPDEQVNELATDYDFSGGEIENIARKQKVEYILSGENVTIGQLREFCDSEKIAGDKGAYRKVGFC